MNALTRLLDPVAERLWDLRRISGSQWLLRGGAAAAVVLALLVLLPGGLLAGPLPALVTIPVLVLLAVQSVAPDADAGSAVPVLLLLGVVAQRPGAGDLVVLALLLLLAHTAWALAATAPAHAHVTPAAWRLTGLALLSVLGGSVLAAGLVLAAGTVTLGAWTLVVGVLAALALALLLLPRTGRRPPPA